MLTDLSSARCIIVFYRATREALAVHSRRQ